MKFHCWTWLLATGQWGNRPFSGAKDRPFTSHIYILWACLLKLFGCAGPRKTRRAPGQPAAMHHLTNASSALPKEASQALDMCTSNSGSWGTCCVAGETLDLVPVGECKYWLCTKAMLREWDLSCLCHV